MVLILPYFFIWIYAIFNIACSIICSLRKRPHSKDLASLPCLYLANHHFRGKLPWKCILNNKYNYMNKYVKIKTKSGFFCFFLFFMEFGLMGWIWIGFALLNTLYKFRIHRFFGPFVKNGFFIAIFHQRVNKSINLTFL